MSLLTHNELRELVESGAIECVDPSQINGASIDLTLGDTFLVEAERYGTIDLAKKQAPRMTEVFGPYYLQPGEFCLASTREVFNLPDDIAALYVLKSSLARSGLNHMNAGFADPTWCGSVLTLEFHNVLSFNTLLLTPGMKCGQMLFFKGSSPVPEAESYLLRGQYNNDAKVQGSKGAR